MTGEQFTSFVQEWGLPAVFIGTILDHTGLPVPLIVGIALAAEGMLEPWQVMIAALLACIVSDLIALALGRYLLRTAFSSPRIGPKVERACQIVSGKPMTALIVGRFIPAIGKYIPSAVGAVGLPLQKFFTAVTVGSVLYVAVFSLAAYSGWSAVSDLKWHTAAGFGLAAAGIIIFTITVSRSLRREGQP